MIKALIKGKGTNKGREQKNAALNNAKSPLLRLPLEVRRLIYEYVLGGNTIVVECGKRVEHTYTRKRWYSRDPKSYTEMYTARNKHHVCVCPFDDETRNHLNAGLFWHSCGSVRITPCPKLELGLLWTCQQTYHEAIPILHSQNTFRFPSTLDAWFHAFQRIITSDLFLNNITFIEAEHFAFDNSAPESGYTAFCNALSLLPNLQRLRLMLYVVEFDSQSPPATWTDWNRPPLSAVDSQPGSEQRKCEWRELLLTPLRRIRTRSLEIWVPGSFGVVFREAEEWEGTVVTTVAEYEPYVYVTCFGGS